MIGAAVGLGVVVALARVYGKRGARKNWRGAGTAVAVGLALGAMVDLLPMALEQLTVLMGLFVRTVLIDTLALRGSSFALVGSLITRAAVPLGAILILLLYFLGNTVPTMGDVSAARKELYWWRARLAIPEAGRVDWAGIVLLTAGLAIQNLWVGQMRGVLVAPDAGAGNLFLYGVTLIGALRGLALFGPWVEPARHILPLVGCDLLIAAAVIVGVIYPETMQSLALGVVPWFIGVLVLPVAIGRLLRMLETETGMSWQAILVVGVTFAIERGGSALLVRMGQGRI